MNQVEFEETKESFSILSKRDGFGDIFKLLGVLFDTQLTMLPMINHLVTKMGNKLKALFRVRKFYNLSQYVRMYKCQLWSTAEWCTAAIYHAPATSLAKIDNIQRKFLKFVDLPDAEAFLNYNLAPMALRRAISLLGLIYKCVHKVAPVRLQTLFTRKGVEVRPATRSHTGSHNLQLVDPLDGSQSSLMTRSIFGLIRYWNALPQGTVNAKSVKTFQRSIQWLSKEAIRSGMSIQHVCELRFLTVPYDVLTRSSS